MKHMEARTVASLVAYNFLQLPSLSCLKAEPRKQEHKGAMSVSLVPDIFLLCVTICLNTSTIFPALLKRSQDNLP